MTRFAITLAACILATPAAALTVPERIPLGEGIYQFVSLDGSSRFGPLGHLDTIYGDGKGAHLPSKPHNVDRPVFAPVPVTQADPRPLPLPPVFRVPQIFPHCCTHRDTPPDVSAPPPAAIVSLPEGFWLMITMIAALGAVAFITKKRTEK